MSKRHRGHIWRWIEQAEDRMFATKDLGPEPAPVRVAPTPRRKPRHTGTDALVAALRKNDLGWPNEMRRFQSTAKARLLQEVGGSCEGCGFEMPSPSLLHMHHIVPLSCGGDNSPSNLTLLCPNCHAIAHHERRNQAETS